MALFSSKRRQPPHALLVWEIGAGFTHSQNLFGVARHLRATGMDCTIATADPRFDPWFRSIGCRTLQTYLWPVMRSGIVLPEQRPAHVLGDVLANYGVCDPANLTAALAHYETLLDLVRPDIVLCENAFGAQLAARGRAPVVVFGSTLLFLPPLEGDGFAPIDPALPEPSWPEDRVLERINAGLGGMARPPLMRIADLFDVAEVLPFGPAAFDPYAHARTGRVLPPHCPDFPAGAGIGAGRGVIAYLHESAQFVPSVMKALLRLPEGSRIYIPSLAEPHRAAMQAAGLIVADRMLTLSEIAAEAGCLLHQGGVTLTAAALALGIPQVILARFHENGIAGRYVTERGAGAVHRIDDVKAGWISTALKQQQGEAARQAAAACASEARSWFSGDPTHEVACAAARQLGLPMPPLTPMPAHQAWSPV